MWRACLTVWLLVSIAHAGTSQLFPAKKDTGKISAFLIAPSEGLKELPPGWERITARGFGNCAIADEALTPARGAKPQAFQTTSYPLPQSDYLVSVCVRGKGMARLQGAADWVQINVEPPNRYQWVELGVVKDAQSLTVEVSAESGAIFFYGGVLAEGDKLDIKPVSAAWNKIRAGQAIVALVGDSVTENAGGTGGGSSSFDKGNPGLMLKFLQEASGKPVGYLAHREPPAWGQLPPGKAKIDNPDPAAWPELDTLPTAEIGGAKLLDARQEIDKTRSIHLLNLGKGGADSTYTWTRLPELIAESDYRFNAKAMAAKGLSGETLRYGLARYRPDLVIINFGTNDVNAAHLTWTVDDFLFFTRCAVTNVQHRLGSAVIVSTPHKWNAGVHLKHHWQPLLVDRLRDFCRRSGVRLADIYLEYAQEEDEGIHPRDPGHAHMAAAYIRAIKGEAPPRPAPPAAPAITDHRDGTLTIGPLMMPADPAALGQVASHAEAQALVDKLNADKRFGHADWRLARRAEVLALVDRTRRPALVEGLPLKNIDGFYYVDPDGRSWGVDLTVGIAHQLGSRGQEKPGGVLMVRQATR